MMRKDNIFNRFSKDLSFIEVTTDSGEMGYLNNAYVCPLCLTAYDINDISELTIEHVPPKSLNGSGIVLTCKKCNNSCGSGIDSSFFTEYQYRDKTKLLDPKGARAKFSFNNIRYNGNLIINNGEIKVINLGKNNNPVVNDRLNEELANGKEWKLDVNVPLTDKPRDTEGAHRALLKSAYLLAFWHLGYKYILQDSLDIIRDEITSKGNGHNLKKAFEINNASPFYNVQNGVYRGQTNSYKCLFVFYTIKHKDSENFHKIMSILPHDLDRNGMKYKKIFEEDSDTIHFELNNRFILSQMLG